MLSSGDRASAGRDAGPAVTRHHWPLVVPLLGVRPVRRLAPAAAVADAVGRLVAAPATRSDLLRFAAARRLEDLAYGAGSVGGARAGPATAAALLPGPAASYVSTGTLAPVGEHPARPRLGPTVRPLRGHPHDDAEEHRHQHRHRTASRPRRAVAGPPGAARRSSP